MDLQQAFLQVPFQLLRAAFFIFERDFCAVRQSPDRFREVHILVIFDKSENIPAFVATEALKNLKVRVDASRLRSRSKNTPFDGWELRGGVAATLVGGRTLFANSEVTRGL